MRIELCSVNKFFALTRLFVWLVTRLMIYSAIFDRIRVRCKKKGPQWAPYTHKENAYLYAD